MHKLCVEFHIEMDLSQRFSLEQWISILFALLRKWFAWKQLEANFKAEMLHFTVQKRVRKLHQRGRQSRRSSKWCRGFFRKFWHSSGSLSEFGVGLVCKCQIYGWSAKLLIWFSKYSHLRPFKMFIWFGCSLLQEAQFCFFLERPWRKFSSWTITISIFLLSEFFVILSSSSINLHSNLLRHLTYNPPPPSCYSTFYPFRFLDKSSSGSSIIFP